jgi:hypothetical protein
LRFVADEFLSALDNTAELVFLVMSANESTDKGRDETRINALYVAALWKKFFMIFPLCQKIRLKIKIHLKLNKTGPCFFKIVPN